MDEAALRRLGTLYLALADAYSLRERARTAESKNFFSVSQVGAFGSFPLIDLERDELKAIVDRKIERLEAELGAITERAP